MDLNTATITAIASLITGALVAWGTYRATIASARSQEEATKRLPADLALSTTSAATQMAGSGAQVIIQLQQQLSEMITERDQESDRRRTCEDERATNAITVKRVSKILNNLIDEHEKRPEYEKCAFAKTQNKTIMSAVYLLDVEFLIHPKEKANDQL